MESYKKVKKKRKKDERRIDIDVRSWAGAPRPIRHYSRAGAAFVSLWLFIHEPLTIATKRIRGGSHRFSPVHTGHVDQPYDLVHPRCNHARNDESCKLFIPNARGPIGSRERNNPSYIRIERSATERCVRATNSNR